MTVLTTTDAIVLKAMKYRDTSRIVTFYTRAFGKLRAIAKGARGPKNKFGSALEPLKRDCLHGPGNDIISSGMFPGPIATASNRAKIFSSSTNPTRSSVVIMIIPLCRRESSVLRDSTVSPE